MSNRENCDELIGKEWLESHCAAVRRVCDDPPDYVADDEFAVEIRRLNLGIQIKGTTRGEEEIRIPLHQHIDRALTRVGKPAHGRSWVIDCEYDFSQGLPKRKVIQAEISQALEPLMKPYDGEALKRMRSDHLANSKHRYEIDFLSDLHLCLKCGICLDLEEVTAEKEASFVLGNVSDGEGILVLSELEKRIRDAVNGKHKKIAHRINRFSGWWLILVDYVGLVSNSGLTKNELNGLRVRINLENPWSRLIIVSRLQPHSWYEL